MLRGKNIRLATENDCTSILEIYAPYITNTAITFEYTIPTITEFRDRMAKVQSHYPWLVCEIDGNIVGYAYASRFREREAYGWSVDFSVYIRPECTGKNIGKALYFALFKLLKLQGYYNAYAGVTIPNIRSEGLHESLGFKEIGVYKNVGYKLGCWHDTKWYSLKLNEYIQSPEKPKSIHQISTTNEFNIIVEEAERMIGIE